MLKGFCNKLEGITKTSKYSNNLEKNSTSKKEIKKVLSVEKGILKLNEKKDYSPNYKSQNKIRDDNSIDGKDAKRKDKLINKYDGQELLC